MNPQDIVSSTPQQSHTVSRHVFVSAQTHRVFSLVRGGKDPFLTQQVSRISKAGADVFLCKAGVIPQNFFLAPSFGEQIQYEFNRQSRSSNDGLAGQNGRVSDDVVMPVHETKLPLLVKFRPAHLRVPEHELHLFARQAGKPLQEVIDSRAVFEILEQCPDRYARVFEQPFATDFSPHAFNGRTLTPIKHNTILREAGLACKHARKGAKHALSQVGGVRRGKSRNKNGFLQEVTEITEIIKKLRFLCCLL
jgi:hypothetical protein